MRCARRARRTEHTSQPFTFGSEFRMETWERGAWPRLVHGVEDPLTLFIRLVSLKARGKRKSLSKGEGGPVGGWVESAKLWECGRGSRMRGRSGVPGDPEVRQRRYPCLRQEFHSIGSVRTVIHRGERGA